MRQAEAERVRQQKAAEEKAAEEKAAEEKAAREAAAKKAAAEKQAEAKQLYISEEKNLNLILATTRMLLHDQNVGSDKLEEARGELKAAVDPFRAACDGLSKSQVRKTQYERNHLWRCVTDCLEDLNVAIWLKCQQEGQAETEQVRQVELAEAEQVRQEKQES